MIYKLQLYTTNALDEVVFKDFYFDVTKVSGFFIPEEEDDNNYTEDLTINILYEGDMITVKQEKHITDYLYQNFVKKSIK